MAITLTDKALFLTLICFRQKEAENFFRFFSAERADYFRKLFQELSQRKEKELRAVARLELRKLAKSQIRSVLGEIHDDWIADRLAQESPAMISLLLRQLPTERVARLIDALPARKIKMLPRLAQTFSVPDILMGAIQKNFEEEFRKKIAAGSDEDLAYLPGLNLSQILRVFMELGYREIALALTSVPVAARERVLGRISSQSRQRVMLYLPQVENVSESRRKRAQIHLVSKDIDVGDQDTFVRELGLVIFGKALVQNDMPQLERILLRFSKRDAGLIKGMIMPHMERNNEAMALAFREEVRHIVGQIRRAEQ